ncbi:MAG: tRNA (adenosine(37)-N6)-dimethylallyltransferase MiaA [Candidatus Magasanikbacteria bacterium]|uniref:tRNA dimethylallyltransferase n=1 Tax=Candidatus Magasanikbacteria bacterium CG10_big_fil_rev_8_21_14_0_10_38_6 TaxID=1974647 RepID=A0A2M6P1W2_9BACT|nr:tRNA (adenosine(37)-N6)-dimethylallyltransferase MiaA [Candidatus Magasanikbacteria bacterium]NCS72005.1 tRNA (adenosine(37)-N6)-dimethylallyltransferase MiaA [Candidatus Magasanikbacteria bacterium]PIR77715.1 MAG: tRNA (adenosine(37)-N6)-dimethylallyltransferase MiaA [Candidatus Magasanikbacteria bacterium CG10_big_fil_rev_8_21_14_0_10_38_6]
MSESLPKLVVLLGPTASGKTGLSLQLAKQFDGEIISADSRQIYKKMDIGTAKALGEWHLAFGWSGPRRTYFVEDVPHHLVDFLNPGKRFTVAQFRDKAIKYGKMAHQAGKIPMIVGGTGLYISSIVDNLYIPRVPPNKALRESLEQKTTEELMQLLSSMDPVAVQTIDVKNKRRIIRALEVCIFTGESFSGQKKKGTPVFDILQLGIRVDKETLYQRIDTRVDQMVQDGLEEEIRGLLKQKYSWDLPSMSGIGYRQFRAYIEGIQSFEDAVAELKRDTRRFAKRQSTWFKRDKRIIWVDTYDEAVALATQFLS